MSRARDLADLGNESSGGLTSSDISDIQVKPHIIPGVLYPAVSGKRLDGSTSHSGNYGTAQSDGRSYYYTDIKGSKPIKDPRIGGHFGSQRHKFKSLQLLEQETATHGENVYSVDGREWIRCVSGTNGWNARTDSQGNCIEVNRGNLDGTDFMEITGYFNFANISVFHNVDHQDQTSIFLNGTDTTNDLNVGDSIATPLMNRFVDPGALVNLNLGTINTPGINTIKLTVSDSSSNNYYALFYAIELIAQDTSNRNNIQIPSQDVVSYGKKFTVSGTPHYDPFTTMSYGGSGTTLSALQSLIDTDTSLGMDAWKAGTSNYHRPWNGGRVIKWVDSSGAIKTSVNMMPPNAQNITATGSNAVSNAHVIAGTNDDTINFNTSAIDHTQAEVAKTFHWREFGNGSANGGTGATYADASMLSQTSDNIAYVMDDGLSSLSADTWQGHTSGTHEGGLLAGSTTPCYITFIGTGISINFMDDSGNDHKLTIAQNLPYGSHILKLLYHTNGSNDIFVDGVQVESAGADTIVRIKNDITFHQPKRPPILEDACVIADYMLMADFVPQGAVGIEKLSKGTRLLGISRDVFYDGATPTLELNPGYAEGFITYSNTNGYLQKLPFFGSGVINRFESNNGGSAGSVLAFTNDGTNFSGGTFFGDASSNQLAQNTGTANGHFGGIHSLNIGAYTSKLANTTATYFRANGYEVISPIHTSSHYQTFETPFLHELVGGDRNMEQTNLVVSPDGKTWDQLTRDVSYLGNGVVLTSTDSGSSSSATVQIFDDWRGKFSTEEKHAYNKDFAIAYDRLICLKDGQYKIEGQTIRPSATTDSLVIKINGTLALRGHSGTSNHDTISVSHNAQLKRGDYIQIQGGWYGDQSYSQLQISKI